MTDLRGIVARIAARDPHSLALLARGQHSLTYGDLLRRIDGMAEALGAMGIRPFDRVAVVLPNGLEMATAFLGVAAYCACAPLNPAYRVEELEFYLDDLGASAIVVPAGGQSPAAALAERRRLPLVQAPFGLAEGLSESSVAKAEGSPPPAAKEPLSEALVLHTSGTTSRPKQVPLSHRNLAASARHIASTLALSPADRCLNVMPLFHIHGLVGALLSSIWSGGSVICTRGYDDEVFVQTTRDLHPTWYTAVPTIHQSVVSLARHRPEWADQSNLRLIRSSSSALPPTLMHELELLLHAPVMESYGMTEAAHQMASNPLPPRVRKPGSVGVAAGPEINILDGNGNRARVGEVGEIVIRGPNVMSGYANNPSANEAAFCGDWFRTGDLGRVDEDGYYYITGRTKEMINRGGENISPREIDEALMEHPAVAQAVAFAAPHATLGEDLAAVVVLRDGAACDESQLREFAFSRLADFKVPSQIIVLDRIPTGPTGKLQRIGLHERLAALIQPAYEPPNGSGEIELAAFWRELLGAARVGRNDNFFVCGGDSLQAGRLAVRIRQEMGVELTLSDLFRGPTLRAQAQLVEQARLRAESARQTEMESLLDELEELSDEQAAQLLQQEESSEQRPEDPPSAGGE